MKWWAMERSIIYFLTFVKGFGPPIRVCDPMGPSRYTSPRVETLTYATEINFAKVLIYFVYLCGHYDFNREFNG